MVTFILRVLGAVFIAIIAFGIYIWFASDANKLFPKLNESEAIMNQLDEGNKTLMGQCLTKIDGQEVEDAVLIVDECNRRFRALIPVSTQQR